MLLSHGFSHRNFFVSETHAQWSEISQKWVKHTMIAMQFYQSFANDSFAKEQNASLASCHFDFIFKQLNCKT